MLQKYYKLVLLVLGSVLAGFVLGSHKDSFLRRVFPFSESYRGGVHQVSFADIADRVTPSVVSVVSTRITDADQVHEGFEGLPLRRPEENGKRRSLGYGSGFILDRRGVVVTNGHVIDDSRHIAIRLNSGKEYTARLLGVDPDTDVALLKVNVGEPLVPVQLGDSDQVRVGDWVMAVGNPFNYDHTVTVGVVSAKDRKIDDNPFERYIQTDASINYGSSGGPLFNARGQVIAINSAISTRGRGIGFSIPINLVKGIVEQLKKQGRVVRGYLGLGPDAITEEYAKFLHLPSRQGILVVEVSPDSAAAKSGIRRYDVITKIDGTSIEGKEDFFRRIAGTVPGTRIRLTGLRDQKGIEFDVVVRERQQLKAVPVESREPEGDGTNGARPPAGYMGISVQELTIEQRKLLHLGENQGRIVIVNVNEFCQAADAGLSPGDIIVEINRCPVRSLSEYQKLIAESQKGKLLVLLVSRPNGNSRLVTLNFENQ